jgi:hydroxymethylpyrimidine/phosphomethylpyrimidine kinase
VKAGALLSVSTYVNSIYMKIAKIWSRKNIQENIETKTMRVKPSSTKIGNILKVLILRTVAKDYDPFDTILIILPVSLLRWKANDYR